VKYFAALMIGLLVALLRLLPELSLIKSVRDAQGGISIAFALGVGVSILVVTAGLALGAFSTKKWLRVALSVLLALMIAFVIRERFVLAEIRTALADAADSTTPPDRLRALNGFDTRYFGYEIDNRLASNRSSPEDLLRALAQKDQMGTRTSLERNPNTPDDVLEQLQADDE